jgi:hypothetical protein
MPGLVRRPAAAISATLEHLLRAAARATPLPCPLDTQVLAWPSGSVDAW